MLLHDREKIERHLSTVCTRSEHQSYQSLEVWDARKKCYMSRLEIASKESIDGGGRISKLLFPRRIANAPFATIASCVYASMRNLHNLGGT